MLIILCGVAKWEIGVTGVTGGSNGLDGTEDQRMINEIRDAVLKVQMGYRKADRPTPLLEIVMHPKTLRWLRREADSDSNVLLNQRQDGVFKFMNHAIREDRDYGEGWEVLPIYHREAKMQEIRVMCSSCSCRNGLQNKRA